MAAVTVDFKLQEREVTADFEWHPTAHEKPCAVCGTTEESLLCRIEVVKATDDDGEVNLGSPFGRAVEDFLQTKFHHNGYLCNRCYERILNEDFPI